LAKVGRLGCLAVGGFLVGLMIMQCWNLVMNQWIGKVGPQNEQQIHYCIETGRYLIDIAESLDTAQFLLVVEG
jgi:hypothetical protein